MTAYVVDIQGLVQGQGVRPALQRLANARHWIGSVKNTAQGVRLTLGLVEETTQTLEHLIRRCHPALAEVSLQLRPTDITTDRSFRIVESIDADVLATPVPRDSAVCEDCLAEWRDPHNRRFRDPLISCVRCGPRFSALIAMPFDRPRTTLHGYSLCDACRAEYHSSNVRRGYSQTIGCPACGPCVWAEDSRGRTNHSSDEACLFASKALLDGKILAVRGIGGYQLLVDASDDVAVNELRRRKLRATKPFAVLCQNLGEAETLGELDAIGRRALTGPSNPIVIVPRRTGTGLAAGIHPHLSEIGLLLPTTGLHARLLELVGRPLVCTSGNVEGTPLAVDIDEARSSLSGIADVWLHHDRPIAHPLDDSVVRPVSGRLMTIRCARGLAPLPLAIPHAPPAIALGSFQKSACAYSNGVQSVLGPYIGDLDQMTTRNRWERSLASLRSLYRIDAQQWAVDAHPDDVAQSWLPAGMDAVPVWHHHAHIAVGMLEHGWLDRSVIGLAADGQGYGPDGTLWGGEVLFATVSGFSRIASVRRFSLCGGEAAARDPARLAMTLLSQLPELSVEMISRLSHQALNRTRSLQRVMHSSRSPQTSSLGRLVEGVAWIVLGLEQHGYLGEAAIRLEAACDPRANGSYDWKINDQSETWELDWRPMLRSVLEDLKRDEHPGVVAERFHRGLVDCILELRTRCPKQPWVFSGGVFQNRRLCELLAERWPSSGPPLGLPGMIPINDGGLAAGQLAILSASAHTRHAAQTAKHASTARR